MFSGERKMPPMSTRIADFDSVEYQVDVDKTSTDRLKITLFMRGFAALSQAGADQAVKNLYGSYLSKGSGDLSVEINAGSVAEGNIDGIAKLMGLLKRNVLAAPFKIAFEALISGNSGGVKPTVIQIRQGEQMVISPQGDRVHVAIAFHMVERADTAFAEQILEKIAAASLSSNGPNLKFTKEVPAEVARVPGLSNAPVSVGWLLYSINKGHVTGNNMDNVIDLILMARQYVHYHVKASKAHLHQRMRAKVEYFLQVLNRARPDQEKLKKKFRVINF